MNTQSILAKFDAVEITNESRISDEELDFCIKQQVLYENVLEHHRSTFNSLAHLSSISDMFLASVVEDNEYRNNGTTYHR